MQLVSALFYLNHFILLHSMDKSEAVKHRRYVDHCNFLRNSERVVVFCVNQWYNIKEKWHGMMRAGTEVIK